MSDDPVTTIKKFLVLKFMESQSTIDASKIQAELIANAEATAAALKRITDMFGSKTTQNLPNPQQTPINMNPQQPTIQPFQQVQQPQMGQPMQNNPMQNAVIQNAQAVSQYHQAVMALSAQLQEMQMAFFQNVQKIQQEIANIIRSLYQQ